LDVLQREHGYNAGHDRNRNAGRAASIDEAIVSA
jgi:hypothetical protein